MHKTELIANARSRCCKHICFGTIFGLLSAFISGCLPTPALRVSQLHGKVIPRGEKMIDVDMSGTKMKDGDIYFISRLCSNSPEQYEHIHTLDLSDTRITDDALRRIVLQEENSFPLRIKVLKLTNTNVSEAAIKNLQKAVPNCEIIR